MISIVQQQWLVQMKIRYTPLNRMLTQDINLGMLYIYVGFMIRVRDVKRIFIWIRHYCYAIEEIFTSANMIITEFDKYLSN